MTADHCCETIKKNEKTMKKKILSAHNEALYHLINFRISQFTSSQNLLKMDYLSFMICSVVGNHILYKNMLKKKKTLTGMNIGK